MALRPVQRPHPPVWIGVSTVAAARRAARIGDGILLNIGATVTSMKEQMAVYRTTLHEIGRSLPMDRALARDLYVAATDEEAWEVGGPILEARHHSYGRWGMDKDMTRVDQLDLPLVQLAKGRFVIGSPDTCRQELQRCVDELDVNYLLLRLQSPGGSQKATLRAIQTLGERVLPVLRDANPAPRVGFGAADGRGHA
jgi:alkanesulfonate monooxygenase SsuD/methylene tetrahydromethanopterin reductase-like flavin-dependent oxidoreductase (luciferase family)